MVSLRVCVCVCVSVCVRVCVCACVWVGGYASVVHDREYVATCMHAYTCVYMSVSVC